MIYYMPASSRGADDKFSNYQDIYRFENSSYGASVVQGPYSYGGDRGLWELAVIHFTGEDFALCYCTPVTNDVIGHLSRDEVQEILAQIDALGDHDHTCICPSKDDRLKQLEQSLAELKEE